MDQVRSTPSSNLLLVMVASQRGGMNIEDVAKETPEEIFKIPINVNIGMTKEQATEMANHLGFGPKTIDKAVDEFLKLYKLFVENDNTLIEINPLIETPDFQVICADAKLNFDDNADWKHEELFKLRDETQEDQREVAARKFNLSYIGLDGNIVRNLLSLTPWIGLYCQWSWFSHGNHGYY
jgi:succinyl-CoA synthetase beta subunit